MSIARPQNRDEFRQYILTKLGAPVIEINVANEQIDIAIEDAFQFFNERSHFLGTENMYLTFRMTTEFLTAFSSFNVIDTNQQGKNAPSEPIPGRPTASAIGMVDELTLVSSGSGYSPNSFPLTKVIATAVTTDVPITNQAGSDLTTDADGSTLIFETKGDKKGQNLSVSIGSERTPINGITNVQIYDTGYGFEVGELVTINGGQEAAVFEVTKIKSESPVFARAPVTIQNNYLVLPDDVVGVMGVMRSMKTDLVGIFPGGSVFPIMMGGMLGNDYACGDMGYDLVSYVAMREYMATLEFLFFPPIQYSFNQRTHRLYIDTNNFLKDSGAYGGGSGSMLGINVMMKPSPDVFPDLWNDLWLKEYSVALVKAQWGRNLTKYNQVSLPGGITMNGSQILQDARSDIEAIKQRFALDWADPPLDMIG